jgi:hypothetical protein
VVADVRCVCCSCGGRGSPSTLVSAHLNLGSLSYNNIGAAGARDLGAALRVNRTLMELE